MREANRREFLILAGAAACACVMGGIAEAEPAAAAAAGPLDIGTPADYPSDGVYDALAKAHKVLVIRQGERIYAATALCTHKRQTLRVKNGQLGCPAHGSRFGPDGRPTAGPAKSPLARFAIRLGDDGRLRVDRSRTFGEDQWDAPDAFVRV